MSLEGDQPPSVREEELKWEKEPGTQITVTVKEEEETDLERGQKIGEDKHWVLKGAEEEEQGQEEEQDKRVDEKNKTRDEEEIQEEIQGVDQSVVPLVNIPLVPLSPLQYFSSTINPFVIPINTNTPSSTDITPVSSDTEDQNISLSGSHTSHFSALNNTPILPTDENSTRGNSSMGQIETSKENVDADPTAVAARAGPTSMSLPSTFKPKPKTKHPKNKDKQIAKTKKNKRMEKNAKPLKKAKQMKRLKQEQAQLTTTPYFPYFKDHYCPPDCACYGRCVSNTALHTQSLTSV